MHVSAFASLPLLSQLAVVCSQLLVWSFLPFFPLLFPSMHPPT